MTIAATRHPRRAVRAYLELLRLPNVFTAIGDVALGVLIVRGSLSPGWLAGLLVGASSLLYLAGMVLNDVFDAPRDQLERPERPIPSGRVPRGTAAALGWSLLVLVLGAAITAAVLGQLPILAVIAAALAATIVAYDAWVKRTPAGPLAMGLCRGLNLMLGMSAAAWPWPAGGWVAAVGLTVYVVGITWFARTEAVRSRRLQLTAATAVMLIGIATVALYPWWLSEEEATGFHHSARWPVFWLVITGMLAWRLVRAIANPSPRNVQEAVKHAILSIIVIDAGAAMAVANSTSAIAIVLLLVPAVFLGRWIYST